MVNTVVTPNYIALEQSQTILIMFGRALLWMVPVLHYHAENKWIKELFT